MATNNTFGLNRVTMISIAASAVIIGVSIGLTSLFSPKLSSIDSHKKSVVDSSEMKNRCKQFQELLNTDKQTDSQNNVMIYNLQRLYGQCFFNDRPVELLKITGCTKENGFDWKLREDSSVFDFCPNISVNSN